MVCSLHEYDTIIFSNFNIPSMSLVLSVMVQPKCYSFSAVSFRVIVGYFNYVDSQSKVCVQVLFIQITFL